MAMSWLFTLVIVFAIIIIGIGLGLFIYSKVKPKRETWSAVIYHLSKARIQDFTNEKGEVVERSSLTKLVPTGIDLLIYDGQDYKLRDANLTVAGVDADSLNDFRNVVPNKKGGKYSRFVEILVDEGSATILKNGYDIDLGRKIWLPMPYDRAASNSADYRAKTLRYQETMSNWLKALPWIGVILMVVAIMVVGVTLSQAFVKVGTTLGEEVEQLRFSIDRATGTVSIPSEPEVDEVKDLSAG